MTTTYKTYVTALLVVLFIVLGALSVAAYADRQESGAYSVELGLLELSPNGEAGGYAIPASGVSTPTTPSCGYFYTSPSTLPYGGGYFTMYWRADNATGVNITEVGSMPPSGEYVLYVSQSKTYALTATGPGGTTTCPPATITVQPPPAAAPSCGYFYTSPSTLPYGGGYFTMYWRADNATSVNITEVGNMPPSGGYVLYVSQSKTYALTATGPGGTTTCPPATITVQPPPPTATLQVRNLTEGSGWRNSLTGAYAIEAWHDVALNWTSSYADTCSGGGPGFGTGGATGGTDNDVVEPTQGTTQNYTVACSSQVGTAYAQVSVEAKALQPPTISTSKKVITSGDDVVVTWDVKNNDPIECTFTGPGVNMNPISPSAGSITVTLTNEGVFTLVCPGGTATAVVDVLPIIEET